MVREGAELHLQIQNLYDRLQRIAQKTIVSGIHGVHKDKLDHLYAVINEPLEHLFWKDTNIVVGQSLEHIRRQMASASTMVGEVTRNLIALEQKIGGTDGDGMSLGSGVNSEKPVPQPVVIMPPRPRWASL